MFFDQIRASAENDENIAEAVLANSNVDFATYLDDMLTDLFIERMEGNEGISSRVIGDAAFRSVAQDHLAREVFDRVRETRIQYSEDQTLRCVS